MLWEISADKEWYVLRWVNMLISQTLMHPAKANNRIWKRKKKSLEPHCSSVCFKQSQNRDVLRGFNTKTSSNMKKKKWKANIRSISFSPSRLCDGYLPTMHLHWPSDKLQCANFSFPLFIYISCLLFWSCLEYTNSDTPPPLFFSHPWI